MADPISASYIAQQAFRMMELAPISSFADDSPQARDAAEQYDAAMKICLEDADWSFARKLVNLTALAALPDGLAEDADLPVTYELPGDYVMLRLILPETAAWRLDGRYIRTDIEAGLQIRYTFQPDNEKLLPATFQLAVSAQLAAMLSPRWVKTRTKRADLVAQARDLLARARRNDARAASTDRYDGQTRGSDWVSEAVL